MYVYFFYSTNSFATTPPQKLVVDKISFSILNDTSGKIPHSMLLKTLDTAIQSQINTIFDAEAQVKRILAGKYNLSNSELTNLKIKVYDVDTAAATSMVDRHAIFSLQVQLHIGTYLYLGGMMLYAFRSSPIIILR